MTLWIGEQPVDSPSQLRARLQEATPEKRLSMGREMLKKQDRLRRWLAGEKEEKDNLLFELLKTGERSRPAAEILAEICAVSPEDLICAAGKSEAGEKPAGIPGLETVPRDRIAASTEELERILKSRTGSGRMTVFLAGRFFLLRRPELLRGVCLQGFGSPRPMVFMHPRFRGEEMNLEKMDVFLENCDLHPQGCSLLDPDGEHLKN